MNIRTKKELLEMDWYEFTKVCMKKLVDKEINGHQFKKLQNWYHTEKEKTKTLLTQPDLSGTMEEILEEVKEMFDAEEV
jgi:hypothetical protein